MDTETALLLLRIASACLLFALLTAVFIMLWRDYRSANLQVQASRRALGQLVVTEEYGGQFHVTGETYPLLPLTSVGRSLTNTIPLDDSFVSSDHALIILRDGQWWLEDRRSRNGTTLNGEIITQSVVVTHGDIIGIGQKNFRLELE